VDSIPLEWDHDYDLSRDLESAVSRTLPSEDEEGREDKDFYLRGAVGLSGRKESIRERMNTVLERHQLARLIYEMVGVRITGCTWWHRSRIMDTWPGAGRRSFTEESCELTRGRISTHSGTWQCSEEERGAQPSFGD
jgi:hypothetical protein